MDQKQNADQNKTANSETHDERLGAVCMTPYEQAVAESVTGKRISRDASQSGSAAPADDAEPVKPTSEPVPPRGPDAANECRAWAWAESDEACAASNRRGLPLISAATSYVGYLTAIVLPWLAIVIFAGALAIGIAGVYQRHKHGEAIGASLAAILVAIICAGTVLSAVIASA